MFIVTYSSLSNSREWREMERRGQKEEETNTPRYYFLFVFSFAPSPISECLEPTSSTVGLRKDREFWYLLYLNGVIKSKIKSRMT